jgi:hypothetical protein
MAYFLSIFRPFHARRVKFSKSKIDGSQNIISSGRASNTRSQSNEACYWIREPKIGFCDHVAIVFGFPIGKGR